MEVLCICDRSENRLSDILCFIDISENGAKFGSLMVSARILNVLEPAIAPTYIECL